MKIRSKEDQLIVSYLLGEVSEVDQEQIERRFFQDHEFHLLIMALEEDLILDYLRGELSSREAGRFESYFLATPRRQARYQSTKNLLNCIDALPAARTAAAGDGRSPARSKAKLILTALVALTATLLSLCGLWFLLDSGSPKDRSSRPETGVNSTGPMRQPAATAARRAERQATMPVIIPANGPVTSAVSLVIAPSAPGSGRTLQDTFTVRLPDRLEFLQMEFPLLEDTYSSYSVTIKTAGGDDVWQEQNLKGLSTPAGHSVLISIPADQLIESAYVLNLTGVRAEGEADSLNESHFLIKRGF